MSLITEVDILDEAKDNFLVYTEEVLTDRAIPSAEDGLLSAQRKILWTMEDYLKMNAKSKTKKCNAIVGSTLATSYFHGDQACYGVLCKMSQPYLMRYPLLIGQGSLGTQENNDMVASSRYTEAKPSVFTDIMMEDFQKQVVPMKETYNGEFMEPVVLPSIFPNALCNGKQTIAVGLAHNSAPHNLREVCAAISAYLEKGGLTIDELMTYIPGPDFPLGGVIVNSKDVKRAFETGKSDISLKIRGDYEIKDNKIIFTTIPYRTYRNKIKEQILDNADEFEKYIDDFNDESNIGNNRLVFTLKKGVSAITVLDRIFALTDLQSTLSYNMNFIVNGTPVLCSMVDLIKAYVEHQERVLIKATEFDKDKAEKRAHIVAGLIAAVDKINQVIELIKNSAGKDEAINKLINFLSIDEIQAKAILDMKLGKLTRIDKEELINEYNDLLGKIEYYNLILEDKSERIKIIDRKVKDLSVKYGDDRRTKLLNLDLSKDKEEKIIESIPPEKCVVIMTEGGLIKRIPTSSFRTQKRNGKGVKTQDDITKAVIRTDTVDSLMVFTNMGKLYRILVNDIPVGTNVSRGQPLKSLIQMDKGEEPAVIYSIYRDTDAKFVLFATKDGLVKKTGLDEYIKTRKKTGMSAISIKDGDSLVSVSLVKDEQLLILTKNGMCIRFNSNEVTPTSRATSGVKGINLNTGDEVVACLPIRDTNDNLAVFSATGLGKRINLADLPLQKRAGKGLVVYKPTAATGEVAAASLVNSEDNILLLGDKTSICVSCEDIPVFGRIPAGNQIIKGSKILSVSKV